MLVKEAISFQRSRDPKEALGMNMRPEIEEWLTKFKILAMCHINDNMTIDCDMFLGLTNKQIEEFPYFIRFNKALQGFSCSKNKLTTLKGCPKVVNGNFYCYENKLTDLEGAPLEVHGNFACFDNSVTFKEEDVRKICKVSKEVLIEFKIM